jgi:branched-chain amino acid transport system substrate-binding protein
VKRLLAILAASLISAACAAPKGPNRGIRIGFYGSLTGTTATFGQSGKNGAALAVEEINAAGGVLGDNLILLPEDDRSEPEEAASAVSKLISRDHVIALVGEAASSRTLAAAPIAQRVGIPMVTPSSTNPQVTRVGDYIFRACFTDDFQGDTLARFAADSLHARTASLLVDVRSDYSVGLAEAFRKGFLRRGGRIAAEQRYSEGDTDFSAQLTQLRGAAADVLFVPGYYTEVGLIARQKKALAVPGTLLGGDGWDSPKLIEIGGDALEGARFGTSYSSSDPSSEVQRFASRYRGKYGADPDSVAALSYDSVRLLADALRRSGDTSGPRLREALASTKDFPGVTGTFSFDAGRNPVKSMTILEVAGGRYRFVERASPPLTSGSG